MYYCLNLIGISLITTGLLLAYFNNNGINNSISHSFEIYPHYILLKSLLITGASIIFIFQVYQHIKINTLGNSFKFLNRLSAILGSTSFIFFILLVVNKRNKKKIHNSSTIMFFIMTIFYIIVYLYILYKIPKIYPRILLYFMMWLTVIQSICTITYLITYPEIYETEWIASLLLLIIYIFLFF